AKMGADVQYLGEFSRDTLRIPIVFSGRDTTVKMIPGQYLSELEFSALKLFVLQQKLKFELRQYYGENLMIRREGDTAEDFDFTQITRRTIFVMFKKLRIQPDNRNLKGLHKIKIDLRFAANKQEKRGHAIRNERAARRETKKRERRQAKVDKWRKKGMVDDAVASEDEAAHTEKAEKTHKKKKKEDPKQDKNTQEQPATETELAPVMPQDPYGPPPKPAKRAKKPAEPEFKPDENLNVVQPGQPKPKPKVEPAPDKKVPPVKNGRRDLRKVNRDF
ncbi:MAG: hypothetical protein AAF570_23970, partial [Bacteroidota bacterium]